MSNVPETRGMTVECSVTGAKLLGDDVTEGAICARFIARLALAGHAEPDTATDGATLFVALRFQRPGRGIADVTRTSGGVAATLPTTEVAVMDRALALTDVDILADNVAAALVSESQR